MSVKKLEANGLLVNSRTRQFRRLKTAWCQEWMAIVTVSLRTKSEGYIICLYDVLEVTSTSQAEKIQKKLNNNFEPSKENYKWALLVVTAVERFVLHAWSAHSITGPHQQCEEEPAQEGSSVQYVVTDFVFFGLGCLQHAGTEWQRKKFIRIIWSGVQRMYRGRVPLILHIEGAITPEQSPTV